MRKKPFFILEMIFKISVKVLSSLGLAVLIYFVGFQQGCSPVMFDSLEPLSCEEFPAQYGCKKVKVSISPEDIDDPLEKKSPRIEKKSPRKELPKEEAFWKYTYHVSLGEVAFLFVQDISSSTAKEHRNIGSQISDLLYDIKDLKYHIALITMDISSPDNHVRGAYYQDGKFIPIGGQSYLTNTNLGFNPDPSVVAKFKKALEREETRKCDIRNQPKQSNNKYERIFYQPEREVIDCPSSDERGTYAMNLAVNNPAYREFFNRDHVIFIPISDEDVRSGAEFYNQAGFEEYKPEDLDLPATLVATIFKTFPRSRTFSFHPIIIEPGDEDCLKKQNKNTDGGPGTGRGYYGHLYEELAKSRDFYTYGNFVRGNTISICDRDYGSQLKRIALFAKESKIPLPCDDPERVKLLVNGRKVSSDYRVEGRNLYVSSGKSLTLSSRVDVEVYCKGRSFTNEGQ